MTVVALLIATVGLLSVPGALHRLRVRLSPGDWTRLSAASLAMGVVLLELALVVCAAPILDSAVRLPHFFPDAGTGGWASAVGAMALPIVMARAWWRARTSERRLRATLIGVETIGWEGHTVAVVPSRKLHAFAVSGRSPRIVVSTHLLEVLSTEQLRAVLRHEASHLSNGHSRYLGLAAALKPILGVLPPARRSLGVLEVSVERWADEDAAGSGRQRIHVRDALLTVARLEAGLGLAAFSCAQGVRERLDALAMPAAPSGRLSRVATMAVIVAMLALGGGSLLGFLAT